ncbi:uncharacterized protein LOC135246328 isoform X4 [Anguilla rostrata]|uniref:uncharacterized protein LOC135246328 isoform X4 n=1 Tax=Anguilla rostrata TaxID=7938 RepID=UPI0030CB5B34
MAMVLLWTLLWISGYCHRLSAEVLVQYKYFHSGEIQRVSLQAPAETNGTEFIWEWTSHDGNYTNTRIITIRSDGTYSWNLKKESILKQRKYDIYLRANWKDAGVFTYSQTKPEEVNLAVAEVFAVEVKPFHMDTVNEGSDVVMSCEVSHRPDSATLDWERDREPTANTMLIYNNTAHIIIHSADRYSEGSYYCTLRWNGVRIFSIPRTFQVYEDNGRVQVIGLACTAAVCVGVLLLLGGLLFRHLKTAAGSSSSPAEGKGAADPVYSNITDLQQGQGNPDTPKEENDSEELQYLIFSLTTPSLDPHRQQRRQLNPQSHSEQEENDKVIYASVCKM